MAAPTSKEKSSASSPACLPTSFCSPVGRRKKLLSHGPGRLACYIHNPPPTPSRVNPETCVHRARTAAGAADSLSLSLSQTHTHQRGPLEPLAPFACELGKPFQ